MTVNYEFENNFLDIQEVQRLIPHRYPLLLIDKVIKFIPNESIVAIKNVTINEPYFMGHFPDHPVMPGVLMIEAMAQASGILVNKSQTLDQGSIVYFMSIESAKFRKKVIPGDTLYIYSTIKKARAQVWKSDSYIEVEGKLVAESSFVAMLKKGGSYE